MHWCAGAALSWYAMACAEPAATATPPAAAEAASAAAAEAAPATPSAPATPAGPAAPPAPITPATAASIVDEPVNESDYAESRNCVSLTDIKRTVVIDGRHIALVLRRGYVLNQLRQICADLDDDSIISFGANGTQLCDLDRLDVIDRASRGRFGSCFLGRFETISAEQLAALKRSARDARGH